MVFSLKKNVVILDDNRLSWWLRNFFFSQKINLYIYNLGLKQNIIVTIDDYLLSCGSGGSGGGRVSGGGSSGSGSGCNGCDCCLL